LFKFEKYKNAKKKIKVVQLPIINNAMKTNIVIQEKILIFEKTVKNLHDLSILFKVSCISSILKFSGN